MRVPETQRIAAELAHPPLHAPQRLGGHLTCPERRVSGLRWPSWGSSPLSAVATACASGDQRGWRRGRGRQEESGQPRTATFSLPIPVGLQLRTRCGHRGRMSQAGVRAP